jgi:hypothetical protein
MNTKRWLAGLVALTSLTAIGGSVHADPPSSNASRAEELILGLDLDEARKELASGDADDPNIALEKGRLALYE